MKKDPNYLSTVTINKIWRDLSSKAYLKQAMILASVDKLSSSYQSPYTYDDKSLDYAVLQNLVKAIVEDEEVTPLINHFKKKRHKYDVLTDKLIYLYIKKGVVKNED